MLAVYLVLGIVAAVVLYVMRIDRNRKAERQGLPGSMDPDVNEPFFQSSRALFKIAKEGKLMEWARAASERTGFKPWTLSSAVSTDIMIHTPEDLKYMAYTNFDNYGHANRRPVFQELLGDGIFNSDGPVWKEQRRVSSHLFTARQLHDKMHSVFMRKAEKVCEILRNTKPGEQFDFQRLMYCYTFDSINEIAFGRTVDSLGGNKEDLEFQQAFDRAQHLTMTRFLRPFWRMERRLNIGSERELRENVKVLHRYIDKILEERKQEDWEGDGMDVLSLFEEKAANEGRTCSKQDFRDVSLNFLIAGRDTTAAAATWCILELSKSPEVLQRLEEEVRTTENLDEMQFAQAVFLETLRLHPSVPLDGKTAEKADVLPSGIKVGPRCTVCFHPAAYTMNPELYPDPYRFNPDRWLEDGVVKQYDEYLFPQFNIGPRICLGRHMAAMEVKTVLAEIVENFRIKVVPGFVPVIQYSAVLQSKNGLLVTVEPRS